MLAYREQNRPGWRVPTLGVGAEIVNVVEQCVSPSHRVRPRFYAQLSFECGLTPVQWAALSYVVGNNQFSPNSVRFENPKRFKRYAGRI